MQKIGKADEKISTKRAKINETKQEGRESSCLIKTHLYNIYIMYSRFCSPLESYIATRQQ